MTPGVAVSLQKELIRPWSPPHPPVWRSFTGLRRRASGSSTSAVDSRRLQRLTFRAGPGYAKNIAAKGRLRTPGVGGIRT